MNLSGFSQMEPSTNKAGKSGYKDKKTGKIIPFIYDDAKQFHDGEALVRKEKVHFLIDKNGKKLKEIPYPSVKYVQKGEYMFQSDSAWGIISSSGEVKVRMDFTELVRSGMIENVYVARKGDKIGIFSTETGVILPMEYECDEFEKVFGRDGDVYFGETSPLTLKHKDKWGVIELHGKIILPFEYEHLKAIGGYLKEPKGYLGAKKNGKYGLIDYQGKEQIPFEYDFFLGQYCNRERNQNDPYVFMNGEKIVLYDLSAKSVIAKASRSNESYYILDYCTLSKGNKRGVIDTLGNIIIPFEYDVIFFGGADFFEKQTLSTYCVKKGSTCALYVPGVGLKTPFLEGRSLEYGKAYDKNCFIRYKGDECALLDAEFKVIFKFDFKDISFFQNKIVTYDKDGKMGVVGLDGKITWE